MGTPSGAGLLRPEAGMGLAPLPAARLAGVPPESNVMEPILQRQSSPPPPPVSYQVTPAHPGGFSRLTALVSGLLLFP